MVTINVLQVFTLLLMCVSVGGKKSPNIVFILADDYGFSDIGYHNSEISTPTLDALANSGVKLENYYVQPICSPTRSQLMTGRYQIHMGLQHNIIWPSQPYGLPLEDPTVANLLQDNGYSTHLIGKWHLGFYKKEYTPLYRGFDTFYGFLEGGETYYTYRNCDYYHNHTIDYEGGKDFKWCGYDLRDMEEPATDMNGTYSTHVYTDKAIELVEKSSKEDKPFFLYLSYQAVHEPMEVPEHYTEPYSHIKNDYRRIYAGMVNAMDEGVANVTKALKDNGLWEDTILIFSTDNGGYHRAGGYNYPLRGGKATLWEGGIRGIAFVASPLLRKTGTVSRELMHVSDWFPTIADMVGAKVNSSLALDGVSQWEMIRDGKPSSRKEILHNIDIYRPRKGERMYDDTFDTRVMAAIRVGDYKLITGEPGDGTRFPIPTAADDPAASAGSVFPVGNKNLWLFNVMEDPLEEFDLSDTMGSTVRMMLDKLSAYNATALPPMYPESDPNCDPKLLDGFWGPWA